MTAGEADATKTSHRLVAIDLMRGLVMVLMAVDHSSDAFNAGRFFTDSARMYHAGQGLPAAQFLIRWITHLCAPTFLFLAGAGLAFNVKKQLREGKSQFAVDRFVLTRGLLIAAFELWISYFVMPPGKYVFQVLYGIGSSYLLMVPLRRLGARSAFALSLLLFFTLEFMCTPAHWPSPAPHWATLLLLGGQVGPVIVGYPTLHWLALMLLGWAFGKYLIEREPAPLELSRKLALSGGALLLAFLIVRGNNGYGNMRLLRDDFSPLQWLHVSKYPPGLSYVTLELGLCFLGLAAFCAFFSGTRTPSRNSLLMVLGQTPMFFYVLHFPLLDESAKLLGVEKQFGIGGALLGALAVVAFLYPVCRAYRSYKAKYQHGWTRYV